MSGVRVQVKSYYTMAMALAVMEHNYDEDEGEPSLELELYNGATLSSSSSWSTIPSSPPLEDKALLDETALCDSDDDEHDTPMSVDASCPVFEGSLLCGNYYPPEEAPPSLRIPQHQHDWLGLQDQEKVAPLPLFFATRFRTIDAERFAQPPSNRAPAPAESDWYDMFAWLTTVGSSSCDPSSTVPISLPWNGHLSLGPEFPAKRPRTKRKRRHMPTAFQTQSRHAFSPIHINVNAPTRPQHPQTIRPLPIVPVNRPGQEDWEMVFLSVCSLTLASTFTVAFFLFFSFQHAFISIYSFPISPFLLAPFSLLTLMHRTTTKAPLAVTRANTLPVVPRRQRLPCPFPRGSRLEKQTNTLPSTSPREEEWTWIPLPSGLQGLTDPLSRNCRRSGMRHLPSERNFSSSN